MADHDSTVGSFGRAPTPTALDIELDERYALQGALGRGGMGEVLLVHDTRIDRLVALKLMRSDRRDEVMMSRFFREARIQGQLAHPAVVPVHDVGIDRHGNPFFVMKRLSGTTLAHVLARRSTSAETQATWPVRRLLERLVDVCFAVELAHTRGVIHRDLKPANIMLGEFGEAYVLDWGLARVIGQVDTSEVVVRLPSNADAQATAAGELVGTPGYMSPEQVRGEPCDARSDVFALGCILYEIVTAQSALPRGLPAVAATLEATCHRPSERVPDAGVPPELDDLCARATAADASARLTAREFADAIQRYLDGDRDLARRRELAAAHARLAEAALVDAGDSARARAMTEAGRALALDPENTAAQRILGHLLLAAPDRVSIEARAAADAERARTRQATLWWIWRAYAGMVPVMAIFFFLFPIRHVAPILALIGCTAATAVSLWIAARRPLHMRAPIMVVAVLLNSAMLLAGSLVFGPLLIMPIFLILSTAGMVSQPSGFAPTVGIVPQALAMAIPLTLEWLGILPSTYHVEHGGLVLTPWAIELKPALTIGVMLVAIFAQFVAISVIVATQRAAQMAAQDRVHALTWHLRQLLPSYAPTEV